MPCRPKSRAYRAASPARDEPHPPVAPGEPPDLFDPRLDAAPDVADPDALARAATLASRRAMKARRWAEARALAGLAESYARLGGRARGGGQTIETMDLKLLHAVLTDDSGAAVGRMAITGDAVNDPDRALKEDYHAWSGARYQAVAHHQMGMLRRLHAVERQIRALGGEVVVTQTGFDTVADARAWLLDEALALDEVTVKPSPPPGNPWNVGL